MREKNIKIQFLCGTLALMAAFAVLNYLVHINHLTAKRAKDRKEAPQRNMVRLV